MNEDEAFLRDILANPEDDTPRLVYADWLEDHGDPDRAELIRVQCELERLRVAEGRLHHHLAWLTDPRYLALTAREKRALRCRRPEWAQGIERLVWRGKFIRGFLDSGDVRPHDLVARGEELFRHVPLQYVRLYGNYGEPAVRTLAASPHLARLRSLEFDSPRLTPGSVAALAASPHLRRHQELYLHGCRIGPEGARTLAASPHLAGLAKLHLPKCEIGAAGVAALARSPHLAGLDRLVLGHNNIDDAGAQALAESPHLTRLTQLDLIMNPLTAVGVRALVGSAAFRLTFLLLLGRSVGAESASVLASSPNSGRLTELALGIVGLGPPEAAALAASPYLANLNVLWLNYNDLGDEGTRALARSPHLAGLVELGLSRNKISDAGAQALLDSPHLTRLRRVNLRNNELGRRQKARWRARLGRNALL